ncbi:uncharacterized protein LOC123533609 [Mercenaria mercenaria]|uniref:uncharacterized protein LOC123533609 n=1 Tax=Mercenaria mercenaria TaxID=6596 RepID=UPI00234F5C51|nr:uncharacterized protein LOC123533609 [Mercenaria mercenaria]
MGKKNRKQCRNQNDMEGSTDGEKHVRRTDGVPLWLPHGSFAPRSRTKRSWKEKCMQLREGYKILEEKIEKYEDENKILEEKIGKYEDELDQLKQELTDTHKRCNEQLLDCGRLTSHMRELHHLTNSETACPIDSIVKMSQQATDLFKTFTPEIMRFQDTIRSLSAYIDDPKLDVLLSVSSPNRFLSTVSLDEKKNSKI